MVIYFRWLLPFNGVSYWFIFSGGPHPFLNMTELLTFLVNQNVVNRIFPFCFYLEPFHQNGPTRGAFQELCLLQFLNILKCDEEEKHLLIENKRRTLFLLDINIIPVLLFSAFSFITTFSFWSNAVTTSPTTASPFSD